MSQISTLQILMPYRLIGNFTLFLVAVLSFRNTYSQSTDGAASRQNYPVTVQARHPRHSLSLSPISVCHPGAGDVYTSAKAFNMNLGPIVLASLS